MSEEPGWYRAPRWSADSPAPEPPAVDGSVGADSGTDTIASADTTTIAEIDTADVDTAAVDKVDVGTVHERVGTDNVVPDPVVPDVIRIPVLPIDRRQRWRRRALITVLAVVVFVVVLLLLTESIGRRALQHMVEDEIAVSGVAQGSDVRIGRSWWTPSVTRALLTGTMDRVDVDLRSTDVIGLPVESLRYVLSDLGVSISLAGPRVTVTSMGSGQVAAVVDPQAFSALIGLPVTVRQGQVYLADGDQPASLQVLGADLVVRDPRLSAVMGTDSLRFPVADPYMLPCEPTPEVVGDRFVLACSGSTMPGVLDSAFGIDSTRHGTDDTGAEVEIYAPGPLDAGDQTMGD